MNKFILVLLFLIVLILHGCSSEQETRTDETYANKKESDTDRESVIERTAKKFKGNLCKDEDSNHNCYKYCQQMYRINDDEQDCINKLTTGQVNAIYEVYKVLKNPDEDKLKDIDVDAFNLFLNLSIAGLDDLIDDYTRRDASRVLGWIIDNEKIARVFIKEDKKYVSFLNLLKELSNRTITASNFHVPFTLSVGDSVLMTLVIEQDDFVIDWVHDFINEKNTHCEKNTETKACFAVYCKIGKSMSAKARKNWLKSDKLGNYIRDIINEKINSRQGTGSERNTSGWIHEDAAGNSASEIGDVKDVDDWVEDLCMGLTSSSSSLSGSSNTGNSGTGNSNTGNSGTGNSNTGSSNTGSSNTGSSNTGSSNTGSSNTGSSNTGSSNTGNTSAGSVAPNEPISNAPSLCSSASTTLECINHLISPTVTKASITLEKSKEALSWIFADAARAADFLKKAKAASPTYAPLEKFLFVYEYRVVPGARIPPTTTPSPHNSGFNPEKHEIYVGFVADVKPGKNLMELALDTNTANYIVEYINSRTMCIGNHNGLGNGIHRNCFTYIYCTIAEYGELSMAYLKKWFDTPNFKAYLTRIVNGANKSTSKKTFGGGTLKAGLSFPISITDPGIVANWKTGLCKLEDLR